MPLNECCDNNTADVSFQGSRSIQHSKLKLKPIVTREATHAPVAFVLTGAKSLHVVV